ncbi:transporter substrate-binding domain-containing protein [Paracoccus laeviglucosivorans]|uniref:transporter substrate-binding domain-containing protein n=1 Tax=Paracoccus laeviglucosivorans TaxID=1197861 RepID=UPI001C8F9698|nr:transporter substrate-binding domain-containing protein [Paracoccus laeviglucosivorans]
MIDLPLGLLFSTDGPYGRVAHTLLNGAMLACAQINADPGSAVRLRPVQVNPKGVLQEYAAGAKSLIDQGIRHICGCYTSSSRKEVLPLIEKHDAQLWYPSHYEGFETTSNVIYTGAAPNQHLTPLIDYLFNSFGRRAYGIGSNYIWAWESIRVLREGVNRLGGEVIAERYVPVGETDLAAHIDEVLELRPDYVFNALIGSSAYAFFRGLRRACAERGIDQPRILPVASCNLSEPELHEIGSDAADGQISSSVYFASLQGARNAEFTAAYRAAFPDGPAVSAEAEASFIAVHLLARAVARAGSADVVAVRATVPHCAIDAPQGRVWIDGSTMHAYLTPRIGLSRKDFGFDILREAAEPVRPDPYLVGWARETEPALNSPVLRIVR